jgi:hypothetical protein
MYIYIYNNMILYVYYTILYVYIYIHTYIYRYIHTYIYKYIYTYKYICIIYIIYVYAGDESVTLKSYLKEWFGFDCLCGHCEEVCANFFELFVEYRINEC